MDIQESYVEQCTICKFSFRPFVNQDVNDPSSETIKASCRGLKRFMMVLGPLIGVLFRGLFSCHISVFLRVVS
jgi:hypothetical protein